MSDRVNQKERERERKKRLLQYYWQVVCQALCFVDAFGWTLSIFFLLLYRSTYMHKHKIFYPNIHGPSYQLYEHARDYYHLKWCNRDDNCWTNKYTHTHSNITRQDQSLTKQKFNKYITHFYIEISIYVCMYILPNKTVKLA